MGTGWVAGSGRQLPRTHTPSEVRTGRLRARLRQLGDELLQSTSNTVVPRHDGGRKILYTSELACFTAYFGGSSLLFNADKHFYSTIGFFLQEVLGLAPGLGGRKLLPGNAGSDGIWGLGWLRGLRRHLGA